MEQTKRINIAIDGNLHRDLKIAAAVTDMSIKEYVAKALREKMKRDNIPIVERK